jgi:hypothetical protein
MSAPESVERLYKRELGGGALLDIGVYPLSFIQVQLFIWLKQQLDGTHMQWIFRTCLMQCSKSVEVIGESLYGVVLDC